MVQRKIIVYYEQMGYGGVDTHLAHLINHWPNSDDKFIIVSNPDNEGLAFLKQQLKNPSVVIQVLEGVFNRAAKGSSKSALVIAYFMIHLRFVRAFIKLIEEMSPDIILSNNGGYPGGITNWLAAIIAKQKEGTKNSTFILVHHAPTSKIGGPFALYVGLLVRWIKYLGIPLITVSQASKSMLETNTLLTNLHVIYNGLEIKEPITEPYDFKREWNITQEKIIVGIIGPVDPHKGHATMLDVFRQSTELQEKAQLVVVGSGKKELVVELKKRAHAYGLDDSLTFTGFIPGDSHRIISWFDVLVMPTIDFEGFGYSMAEAMSAVIPVVASKVGAIPEVIVDGESGFLLEPRDISGWRVTLERMVQSSALRKQIGIAGRQRIEGSFSAEKMGQKFFNLLTNCD